jgi:pimeloyl-ACP methyl ester carboxylesterase
VRHASGTVRRRSAGRVRIEDTVPDAKLVVIPGAGYVSNLEAPELFNDAVREFCRAHPPHAA